MAAPQPGFERLEAFFVGHGYDPHRHDTYALGLTLHGVQSFSYRGATVHSRPGFAVVLHPDEVHDGRAGAESGFRYRMAYIAPHLVHDALGGRLRLLPFASSAVTDNAGLVAALRPALRDLHAPLEDLQRDQTLVAIAQALATLDSSLLPKVAEARCLRAATLARDFLDANVASAVTSGELEAITGLDRFAIARHFRACFGTSPYRYHLMRRLDRARDLILSGTSLADAAAASGFSDQSHMTRQFKRTYGVSPGQWQRIAVRHR